MTSKSDREYRNSTIDSVDSYIVEGYAALFDPYELYEQDNVKYFERIDKNAFLNTDMSDVIFQYNHQGKVLARRSNGTLIIDIDSKGLKFKADLSGSDAAREMYKEIKAGLVTKTSWGFVVDDSYFDRKTRTRVITKVRKIYDVSCVSIPANDSTYIKARDYINGVNDIAKQELLERRKKEISFLIEKEKLWL